VISYSGGMEFVRENDSSTGASIFFGLAAVSCFYHYYFPPLKWLKGIPVQEPNSIIGYTDFTNEKAAKKMLREKGPLAQYQVLGRQVLAIADKELARAALRDITGKGFFHNPTPDLVPSTIFSSDTNSDWTRRRSIFRKAFSTLSLKAHMPTISRMNESLCHHLEKLADKGEVACVDDIFTQFTIGVICQVAFEMDVDVFGDHCHYGEEIVTVISDVFKVR
jgi:cytochrome P450